MSRVCRPYTNENTGILCHMYSLVTDFTLWILEVLSRAEMWHPISNRAVRVKQLIGVTTGLLDNSGLGKHMMICMCFVVFKNFKIFFVYNSVIHTVHWIKGFVNFGSIGIYCGSWSNVFCYQRDNMNKIAFFHKFYICFVVFFRYYTI